MNQSSSAKIAQVEDQLGNWPRRLYHVPTKTSYEWKQGNRYGRQGSEHKEPQYNIVTYTWGRWRLKDGPVKEMPEVNAISVYGTTWDLPRVRPDHFTCDDFVAVLESATIDYDAPRGEWFTDEETSRPLPWGTLYRQLPKQRDVEFVWIDVACLDQTRGSSTTNSEKGRQVAIFSKAKKVFAWLCTKTLLELQTVDMVLESFRGTLCEAQVDDGYEAFEARTRNLRSILRSFLEDPWFTSLWTLQESFLRSDAVFLSKEGKMARLGYQSDVDELLDDRWEWEKGEPPPEGNARLVSPLEFFVAKGPHGDDPHDNYMWNDDTRRPFAVHDLVDMCQRMTEWSGRASYDEIPTPAWKDIMELWRKVGIAQIASGNFFAVSIAATRRECKRSEDRVYGIQQLFQLRLGNTAVGKAGQMFTQDQLQNALTTTLLKDHSALSQMHVFSTPVAFGDAWKINESSVFPRMAPERFYRIWSSRETFGGPTDSSRALNMRRKENEQEDSYIRSKGYTQFGTDQTCQFEATNIDGRTWARFKGHTTPFSRFISRCYEEENSLPEGVVEVRRATTGFFPKGFSFKLFLDAPNETLSHVDPSLLIGHHDNEHEAYGLRGINGGGYLLRSDSLARQEKLAEQLATSIDDSDHIIVLEMITNFGDPFWSDYDQNLYRTHNCYWSSYGLLLQRKEDQGVRCYRRLGYCYWEDYHVSKRRDRARWGEWSLCDGIFG